MFAEVLWYLKGSNSLDHIAYYAPNMKKYSADGRTLSGTAYGPKIFNWEGTFNQWDAVIRDLQNDPDSKRAVIHIRNPNEFFIPNNIDATCTLTLQFFNRDDKLHMFTSMRANDMFRGVLSDVFSFTFIMELLSKELGLGLGNYTHVVASSHVYESDFKNIQKVLRNKKRYGGYDYKFTEMPEKSNVDFLNIALKYEELLRMNHLEYAPIANELPQYWEQIVLLLEIKRQIEYIGQIKANTFDKLIPLYQYFIKNCFEKNMP